ncbi:MAG: hypothetical protein GWO20_03325 [Candidatus Korarchaeota archaeon]|nr:hypothetical protein [Candidatus Korarchaeota archaeon]NIU81905.1 hypothetical protein [Candidatus Thorarchaeota archaeon]NIW12363.1 hypothetical protein [Candidatus Thorarchaeota archaeon]NIW51155.1 hypothetical protein [Candidatus Korarchaeota archaeon]
MNGGNTKRNDESHVVADLIKVTNTLLKEENALRQSLETTNTTQQKRLLENVQKLTRILNTGVSKLGRIFQRTHNVSPKRQKLHREIEKTLRRAKK